MRRLRNYLNHPRFRRRSDATLLRPMRPSSFAVGICPFPDLSIIVLQDDNYYSPCVRCTRAAGLWIAYLYLYRLKEVLRGPPRSKDLSNSTGVFPIGEPKTTAKHSVWSINTRATDLMIPRPCLSSLFLTAHTAWCVVFAPYSCGSTPYSSAEVNRLN